MKKDLGQKMSDMPIFKNATITPKYPKFSRLEHLSKEQVELNFDSRVTVISGKNGVGKSTLLKAIQHKVLEDTDPGISIDTDNVMHFFFKLTEMSAKTMLREAPVELQYDPRYIATWMDRSNVSHGQMNSATLDDLRNICKNDEGMVVFVDEPELGLDADNIKAFVDMVVSNEHVQFVIITHHPFLLLDNRFTHMELTPGYRKSVKDYIQSSGLMCLSVGISNEIEVVLGVLGGNKSFCGVSYPPELMEQAIKKWTENKGSYKYCEYGSPMLSQTLTHERVGRITTVDQDKICARIMSVKLSDGKILGTIKPTGPYAPAINPSEVNFAIRALSDSQGNLNIITWDVVPKV